MQLVKDGTQKAAHTVDDTLELGAYWFRPGDGSGSGMPRMIRWPRKKADQKTTANNEELALAA
ncbi:MAG: hypothetical protein ACI8QF_000796 [Limisphaerales bacterium]|jgi:hypothetical protein